MFPKAVLLSMACAAFAAHAGFYRVEKCDGDEWRIVAPDGKAAFLSGVDHVQWSGHRCERTGRAAYHETNLAKYGSKSVWETNTLARLEKWGFNLLGAGCDVDLRRRGLAHTVCDDRLEEETTFADGTCVHVNHRDGTWNIAAPRS